MTTMFGQHTTYFQQFDC